MGYFMLITSCYMCKRVFTCNPDKVPSVKIEGVKEPICESCVKWMQQRQREMGVPVWADPLPGAYDAADEDEV